MRPASSPYFPRKSAAAGGRRFVDDPPAFVVCAAPVLHSGLDIFGQALSAGVELAGPYALASPGHREAKARITAFAKPSQIVGGAVSFVPVNVIDHQKASCSADGTLGGWSRKALRRIRPVTFCAVGDSVSGFPPVLATERAGYSSPWSSSSPSSFSWSSSSGGATISAISSSCDCNSSFSCSSS